MIKRQYIVDCEVVEEGKTVKWFTASFELTSWFPVHAGDFSQYVRAEAADYHGVDASNVRIKGLFKL